MTLCSKKPRRGKPIACHRARQGIAHDKAIKAKAWQALPIACHRAGQGIAHGKAIKAKASGRQGMESRLLVTGQGKAWHTYRLKSSLSPGKSMQASI